MAAQRACSAGDSGSQRATRQEVAGPLAGDSGAGCPQHGQVTLQPSGLLGLRLEGQSGSSRSERRRRRAGAGEAAGTLLWGPSDTSA